MAELRLRRRVFGPSGLGRASINNLGQNAVEVSNVKVYKVSGAAGLGWL